MKSLQWCENGKRVTNRELAIWLAQGKGECRRGEYNDTCYTDFNYNESESKSNETVWHGISVRTWDDDTWHAPTKEYLGIKE